MKKELILLFLYRFLALMACPFLLISCVAQPGKVSNHKSEKTNKLNFLAKSNVKSGKSKSVFHFDTLTKKDYLRKVEEISNPKIVVVKSKRRLYVIDGDTIVRRYPIALGKNPRGDKTTRGDGKTPEGIYRVCVKNPKSRFYKSIGIDYPSQQHAEKAFVNGLISAQEYRKIIMAHERKNIPPWDTKLGGAIFIHGGGAYADWTDGCIALYNTDMDELFKIVSIGTPVYILP